MKRSMPPAHEVISALLENQELALALRPHMAKARWAEVVGPQVAGVTQVEAVRDGVLVVRVRNSVWANELVLLKDDMIRRLNRDLGGPVIRDIHFKGGGLRKKTGQNVSKKDTFWVEMPDDAELASIVLSEETRARVERTAAQITDEGLRQRIHSSLIRAARLDSWKRSQGWLPCERCAALTPPHASSPSPVCELCRVKAV